MYIKTKLHKSTTQQILQHINRYVKHASLHVFAKDIQWSTVFPLC